MRIALLTDIHANAEALDACLAYAEELGAERYAYLGDLIGYGADPREVLDRIMAHVDRGARAVLGNHDAAVLRGPRKSMNEDARRAIEWTRARLDARHLEFLAGLPLSVEEDDRLYVHANAWAPGEWAYITGTIEAERSLRATHCRYTFCGHMHEPMLYYRPEQGRARAFKPVPGIAIPLGTRHHWLAIPGSAGQPRDGNPAAAFAMHDAVRRELTYHRVPYDHESAAAKIRAAGLPPNLGMRIEEGN